MAEQGDQVYVNQHYFLNLHVWSKIFRSLWATFSAIARTLGGQESWDLDFVNLHYNINLHVKFHQNGLVLKIGYGVSIEIVE